MMAASAEPRRELAFTVIDEAIHLLDTPSEPWGIQLEAAIAGHLEEGRLRNAVGAALARHPMARARQRPARRSDHRWCWDVGPDVDLDPLAVVDCPDNLALAEARSALYSRPQGLGESPPLRLVLARTPGGDAVLLNANHAAFDGFGALAVLASIARAYAGRADPGPEVRLEEARDLPALLGTDDADIQRLRRRALLDKIGDLASPPVRLSPERGTDRPGYGFHHLSLSVPRRPAAGTINDLLMVALHLAIDGWNAEHAGARRTIGVLMPVNLRPGGWRNEVVTNLVLESRVATTARQRASPAAALDAVAAQTAAIKAGGGGALFELLRNAARLPLWAKSALSPLLWLTGNRLVDTAVFSNLGALGDVPCFGPDAGATTGVWMSAPTRMPSGLSLGAVSAAGRLHLSFRYRHPLWGPEVAARFAQRFVVELGVVEREVPPR